MDKYGVARQTAAALICHHPQHRTIPSTAPRTRANDMFPCNPADLLLRRCGADHRRETITYDKRRQGGLERLALFTVRRNAIKCGNTTGGRWGPPELRPMTA
jgi:hypothetical protein